MGVNSSTAKVGEKSTISSFESIAIKHDGYRSKDCMKKFCESWREHTMEIINFKKNKMNLLKKEQKKSYENVKIVYICKKISEDKHPRNKKYCKVRDHCYYPGKYGVLYMVYVI